MREMNNLRNEKYFSHQSSKLGELRKMNKKTKNKILFAGIIAFNLLWIPYVIDDWVNVVIYPSPLLNPNYFSETCWPGDGHISGWEYLFFYLVCPMVSAIAFIEFVKGWENEKKD